MKPFSKPLFFFLYFVLVTVLLGQRLTGPKPAICMAQTINKGKYKILSISSGVELQFYLEIRPQFRNDKNYITIAKEFKEKYCQASQLRVVYLASKKQWLIRDPHDIEGTPLAIFYTSKNRVEEEGIRLYTVTNGKVETRKLAFDKQ